LKIGQVECWAAFDVECARIEVEQAKDSVKHALETWSEGFCALNGAQNRKFTAETRLHDAITVREGHVCEHPCLIEDELF